MRLRLEYAGLLWLKISNELNLWNSWMLEHEDSGFQIPDDIVCGLAGVEEAWNYSEEYFLWADCTLKRANQRLENYILACLWIEANYNLDMVC